MKAIPRRQSRPLIAKDNTHIFGFSTPEQANKFCKWAKHKNMDAWTVDSTYAIGVGHYHRNGVL